MDPTTRGRPFLSASVVLTKRSKTDTLVKGTTSGLSGGRYPQFFDQAPLCTRGETSSHDLGRSLSDYLL